MDGDFNRVRKSHSRRLESFAVETRRRVEDLVISFGLADVQGITTLHEDTLVTRATIANYEVAWVFMDSESFVNIFLRKLSIRCR